MYNKIFTKILDSSIWLETDATRLVWLTLIAAMDEDGFAQFASVPNLAHRARVEISAAEDAVKVLESPDINSGDPDHNGRRIERVPGGWIILNAGKYRDIVTRAVGMQRTRERVAKFRAKHKHVTTGNGDVTPPNEPVTPSVSDTQSTANTETPVVPLAGDKPPFQENDSFQLRVGTLFNRRPHTQWDRSELKAYAGAKDAVWSTSQEDWALLKRWFALPQDKTRSRKSVASLLNNWNTEISRAQIYERDHPRSEFGWDDPSTGDPSAAASG